MTQVFPWQCWAPCLALASFPPPPPYEIAAASSDVVSFSASSWHRQRRREILAAHPEVQELIVQSDDWVALLGLLVLPCYGFVLSHAAQLSMPELCLHVCGIGSLRANWAIYCSHALSHGRWSALVGPSGSARFNIALAAANIGHAFQVIPSYWVMHQGHHTRLGSLSLLEARARAKQARPTDGDLGIATRLFSPPAHKYRLVRDRRDKSELLRQPESLHQAMSALVHAIAPIAFAGYLVAAIRTDDQANPALRRSLAVQACASLCGYLGIAALSVSQASWAPLGFYLASSLFWLSPLNINFAWTSPHPCQRGDSGQLQPTVSFYTPRNAFGALLDVYMGWENYHVEHHDFPEIAQYLLPRLREIAPEAYEGLSTLPLLEQRTWDVLLRGNFSYACQDLSMGVEEAPVGAVVETTEDATATE